jgi:hypothetical protein
MFVHHVFFWLKNPQNIQDQNDLKKGLESLLEIEPKILAHIGTPASTNRSVIDTSYQLSLLLVFNTLEEQESYQKHPVHLKFIEECSALWEKVVVYDSVD